MTALARGGIQFTNYETGWRLAKAIVAANMQPKSFGGGQQATCACFVAMQLGAEVGLSPMQSIQNIAVINGKPGIYGPAALALVEASGKLVDFDERLEGEGDKRQAVVTLTRVGRKERRFTFSVDDAKKAGLWGKQGPWAQYPNRMLTARARGFALRDVFPDVLLGVTHSIEELSGGSIESVEQLPAAFVQQQAAAAAAVSGGLDEFIDTAATEVREEPPTKSASASDDFFSDSEESGS
ncbi:hypothetical protein OV079_00275 [Nannocystis pusilla]|uniref:Uncharacterized protein n=1 Tax=Nannocystis pusilla TaxID=889268 RepID=A0A9X3EH88_9BACT|nr:hypothetical protein [Nannocystis pusilla]MCY1004028.1 hypothetical protein [Nannocystis pusilla]